MVIKHLEPGNAQFGIFLAFLPTYKPPRKGKYHAIYWKK